MIENKKRGADFGGIKAIINKPRQKLSKSCLWGLFETINGFMKLTNIVWSIVVNKTMRLLHVNIISETFMEKYILDIELPQGPTSSDSNRNN